MNQDESESSFKIMAHMKGIGQRWTNQWDALYGSFDASLSPEEKLHQALTIFLMKEMTPFKSSPKYLEILGITMAAIGHTKTHSKSALQSVFKTLMTAPEQKPKWKTQAKKAAAIWAGWSVLVISWFLLRDEFRYGYIDNIEIVKLLMIPPIALAALIIVWNWAFVDKSN